MPSRGIAWTLGLSDPNDWYTVAIADPVINGPARSTVLLETDIWVTCDDQGAFHVETDDGSAPAHSKDSNDDALSLWFCINSYKQT